MFNGVYTANGAVYGDLHAADTHVIEVSCMVGHSIMYHMASCVHCTKYKA